MYNTKRRKKFVRAFDPFERSSECIERVVELARSLARTQDIEKRKVTKRREDGDEIGERKPVGKRVLSS